MMRISVEDQGPGIPPEQQAGLFERFYRVRSDSDAPGVGLGLAIAKGIVEAHGGSIGIDSEVGSGTQRLVHPAPSVSRRPRRRERGILLVDDDRELIDLLAFALNGPGWSRSPRTTHAGALRLFEEHKPGLVVLDINLGGSSGLDVLKELRRRASAAGDHADGARLGRRQGARPGDWAPTTT